MRGFLPFPNSSVELALVVIVAGELRQVGLVEHGEGDFHRVQVGPKKGALGLHGLSRALLAPLGILGTGGPRRRTIDLLDLPDLNTDASAARCGDAG